MSCFSFSRYKCLTNQVNLFARQFCFNYRYRLYHNYKLKMLNQQVNYSIACCHYRDFHINHVKFANESKIITDTDTDLYEFNSTYDLIRNAVQKIDDHTLIDAVNWNVKVLDYNAQDGKKDRGVAVLKAYKILSSENLTSEGILQASILGWCVEMLNAFAIMCDDIMDHSTVRRGKPCWYQRPDVGLTAINDALLLECGIYKILNMYFKKLEAYDSILHEFLQVTHQIAYGQCLDAFYSAPNQKTKFENFKKEKYAAIVKYKTSHYTFRFPVHLAMHLNGNFSVKDFEATEYIGLKIGHLYQIQDDHIDAFGDPKITGKIGTDIVNGKCTWFAVSAFEDASDPQKQIMKDNYGVNDADSKSKVMKLYKELNLEDKFHECEEKLVKEIKSLLTNTLSNDSLQKIFNFLLHKIHKRKK